MTVAAVQHGQVLGTQDVMEVNAGLRGLSIGTGSFVVTAAAITNVTDAAVSAGTRIVCFPANPQAGLLLRTATCYTVTGGGSFTFGISATSAGVPAGTELFNYIVLSES